jgi:hypothetical protein
MECGVLELGLHGARFFKNSKITFYGFEKL